MTEHHGLDLDEIARQSGGHSIFAPSASAMWLLCSGSLIPNITAPDDAGIDAAYGTVGHGVGETWLNRVKDSWYYEGNFKSTDELLDDTCPRELIGTTQVVQERREAFEIKIDEEMVAYVRQYVEWCAELPGTHYVEQRVDFSDLTPIPDQGGTADHAACEPGRLVVSDLKMGKGEQVFAAGDIDDPRTLIDGALNGNPQALLYAYGFFKKYDAEYDFQEIEIRIAQPRINHFQTWKTTREELLRFAQWARVRAAAAWVPDAPRTPSYKGCRWCKIRHDCAALVCFLDEAVDGVFDAVDDEVIEGQYRVVSGTEMVARKSELTKKGYDPKPLPPGQMTTEHMAMLLPYRGLFERWFKELEAELIYRAKQGEDIPGYKLVPGRLGRRTWIDEEKAAEDLDFIGVEGDDRYKRELISPAQAEEKIKARAGLRGKAGAVLIKHLVTQSDGRETLVPLSDKREEIEDYGNVFDPVEDDL